MRHKDTKAPDSAGAFVLAVRPDGEGVCAPDSVLVPACGSGRRA